MTTPLSAWSSSAYGTAVARQRGRPRNADPQLLINERDLTKARTFSSALKSEVDY